LCACPWGPNPRKDMNVKDFERYRNNANRIMGYMPMRKTVMSIRFFSSLEIEKPPNSFGLFAFSSFMNDYACLISERVFHLEHVQQHSSAAFL